MKTLDLEVKLNGTYYSVAGSYDPMTNRIAWIEFRGPEYELPDGEFDDIVTDPVLIGALTKKVEDELTGDDPEPDHYGNWVDSQIHQMKEQ